MSAVADVVVLGRGPGAVAAALRLAAAGCAVCVVGDAPAGAHVAYLDAETVAELDALGVHPGGWPVAALEDLGAGRRTRPADDLLVPWAALAARMEAVARAAGVRFADGRVTGARREGSRFVVVAEGGWELAGRAVVQATGAQDGVGAVLTVHLPGHWEAGRVAFDPALREAGAGGPPAFAVAVPAPGGVQVRVTALRRPEPQALRRLVGALGAAAGEAWPAAGWRALEDRCAWPVRAEPLVAHGAWVVCGALAGVAEPLSGDGLARTLRSAAAAVDRVLPALGCVPGGAGVAPTGSADPRAAWQQAQLLGRLVEGSAGHAPSTFAGLCRRAAIAPLRGEAPAAGEQTAGGPALQRELRRVDAQLLATAAEWPFVDELLRGHLAARPLLGGLGLRMAAVVLAAGLAASGRRPSASAAAAVEIAACGEFALAASSEPPSSGDSGVRAVPLLIADLLLAEAARRSAAESPEYASYVLRECWATIGERDEEGRFPTEAEALARQLEQAAIAGAIATGAPAHRAALAVIGRALGDRVRGREPDAAAVGMALGELPCAEGRAELGELLDGAGAPVAWTGLAAAGTLG